MSNNTSENTTLTAFHALQLGKKPYLIVLAGKNMAQQYLLDDSEIVIGRGNQADIVLDDEKISRRHVRIALVNNEAHIEDLNSTNGTYINNERIETSALMDGDVISVGNSILKYTFQSKVDSSFHEEMVDSAKTDTLTGLLNRRYFNRHLETEFTRSQRSEEPLSLLLCDLDKFKSINDTYGHQVGDIVLRLVADTISAAVRHDVDVVGRFGGEEIVVLLPETDQEGACQAAEKIRSAVEQLDINHEEGGLRVTISIGVATSGDAINDAESLIKQADDKVYLAKENGRNRLES